MNSTTGLLLFALVMAVGACFVIGSRASNYREQAEAAIAVGREALDVGKELKHALYTGCSRPLGATFSLEENGQTVWIHCSKVSP